MSNISVTVADRLQLIAMLPNTGNMVQMQCIKNILSHIEFHPKEMEEISMKQNGNQITWDKTKGSTYALPLTANEEITLKEIVDRLDKEAKISKHNFDLCVMINELGK